MDGRFQRRLESGILRRVMRTAAFTGALFALGLMAWPAAAQSEDESSGGSDSAESGASDQVGEDSDEAPKKKPKKAKKKKKKRAVEEDAPKDASDADEKYSHAGQFGLRMGIVGGYRMVFRYDNSPFCRTPDFSKELKDQQKFCGFAAPAAFDFALSFTAVGAIEPFLWARLGLAGEDETDTKPINLLGLGVRLYTMSDSAFKIFVAPALGMEFEGGRGSRLYTFNGSFDPQYKTDIIFHLAAGPQYDFARYFGIYANMAMTVGVLRYIHATLEGQFGVQARFP